MKPLRQKIVGINQQVPILGGSKVRYISLDNAASTPALKASLKAINDFMPWYSSVHRGSGYKSQYSTQLFEDSREVVAKFFGANKKDHVVIFGKNTTEVINKLARRLNLSKKDVVLIGHLEHHSNDLPWRQAATVIRIEVDESWLPLVVW